MASFARSLVGSWISSACAYHVSYRCDVSYCTIHRIQCIDRCLCCAPPVPPRLKTRAGPEKNVDWLENPCAVTASFWHRVCLAQSSGSNGSRCGPTNLSTIYPYNYLCVSWGVRKEIFQSTPPAGVFMRSARFLFGCRRVLAHYSCYVEYSTRRPHYFGHLVLHQSLRPPSPPFSR